MQRAKRREESTKGSSTLKRTHDPPSPTPIRLHPLTPPKIPPQTTYTPHPTQNPDPSTSSPENTPTPSPSPSTQTPTQLPLPTKIPTLLDLPLYPNPGPSTSPPENPPTPNPTPSLFRPPPPQKKKKKQKKKQKQKQKKKQQQKHTLAWGHLSPLSQWPPWCGKLGSGNQPVSWWPPWCGSQERGGREATPLFQMTTRNEQGTRQPNRQNSKCRTRPDGRPGSKEEPRLRIGSHGKTPRRRKTARKQQYMSVQRGGRKVRVVT